MMKHKHGLFLIVAAGSLALSVAAHADTTTSPVDPGHPRVTEVQERQAKQQDRIAKGIASGSLTPAEAQHLEKKEAGIEKRKEADMAAHGGHLTKPEQHRLNRQENRASHAIYRKKHNARTAPSAPPSAPAAKQ